MFTSLRSTQSGPGAGGLSLWSHSVTGVASGRDRMWSTSEASLLSSFNRGANNSGFGVNPGFGASEFSVLSNNEKWTMQNLNERLAAYLAKVKSLEEANQELELKIRTFLQTKTPAIDKDLSSYFDSISLLQSQIQMGTLEKNRLLLCVDNLRLAMEDFKQKYELGLMARQAVDHDISAFRRVYDEYSLMKSDLEMQIESLQEELIYMKKNHGEEQADLHSQKDSTVNVELDSAPQIDLLKTLEEMRQQYEGIIEKNHREAEKWYQAQSEELKKEVVVQAEITQTPKSEVTEKRRLLQGLEVELQSALSMKNSTQSMFADTEARYSAELKRLQGVVDSRENELSQMRSDMEHHADEYQQLLDVKIRLEMEIDTYRRLLEGDVLSSSSIGHSDAVFSKTSSSSNLSSSPMVHTTESSSTKSGVASSSNIMSRGNVSGTNERSSTGSGSTVGSSTTSTNNKSSVKESSSTKTGAAKGGNTEGSGIVRSNNASSYSTSSYNDSDATISRGIMTASTLSGGTGGSSSKNESTLNHSTKTGGTIRGSATSGGTESSQLSGGTGGSSSKNESTLNHSTKTGGTISGSATSGGTESSHTTNNKTEVDSTVKNNRSTSVDTGKDGLASRSTLSSSTESSNISNGSSVNCSNVSGSAESSSSSKHNSSTNSDTAKDGLVIKNILSSSTKISSTVNGSTKGISGEHASTESSGSLGSRTANGSTNGANTERRSTVRSISESDDTEYSESGSPMLYSPVSGSPFRKSTRIRRIKTVTQDLEDGQVIATSVEEREETMEDPMSIN